MYLSNKKTIMFITGAFVNHSCWKEWIIFFESKGYKTVAPPWPHKNESSDVLRQTHPNSKIAKIRLNNLLDYYIEIIEKLPEKPILIGHSYGGLLTQLLIQKDLGYAGICIHPFPPGKMLYFNFSFYKIILYFSDCFISKQKTYLLSLKNWKHFFSNQMSFEEQKDSYEKLVIPESKLVLGDIFSKSANINFKNKHNPILFLASFDDHFIPSAIIYSNFKKYKNIHSITCYKEFRDTNHLVLVHRNWKTVAEFIANWLEKIA
ncbi:alpha/beta hydrolase [Flavobacterium sp. SH_e]|uniref:alpha/beta fold hydrolase n=2 Tax=Flavobacterium TaxID=237 RepID=UPI0021E3955C|nr:alpha/beta hydrolase [Flavobacterium sp. SH_e]MCV2485144.1 alpha/beta hydrolase [Flavobacterium sp. SH_e]